ncbi:MAG: hypothetical protein WCD66_05675 [Rhodanobacteraceae bacterium]
MKYQCSRLTALCGGLLLIAALVPVAHSENGAARAQLRIANLVQRSDSLNLRLCREAEKACRTLALAGDSLSPVLDLTPGQYHFELRTADHLITRFTYGIAANRHYGMALYGVRMHSTHRSLWSRMRLALGGIDIRQVDGYRIMPHMTMMRPGKADDPAVLRLANLAPGSTALSGRVRMPGKTTSLGSVRYGEMGQQVLINQADGKLEVGFAGDGFPLVARHISFARGSNTVIYVGALNQAHPLLLIDSRTATH